MFISLIYNKKRIKSLKEKPQTMKSLIFSLFLIFALKNFASGSLAAASYDNCGMPKMHTSNGIQIGVDYHPSVNSVSISTGLTFDLYLEVSHCSITSYTVTYEFTKDSTYSLAYSGGAVAHLFQLPGKYTVKYSYSGWFMEPFVFYLLQKTVGAPELASDNVAVSVYPNPATNLVYVSSKEEVAELILMDLNSRIIIQCKVQSSNFELPVGELPKGVYLVRIATLNSRVAIKRIVVH